MPRNLLRGERSQILVLHRQGLNIMQISQEINATRSTVRRWIRRYAAEGTLADRPRGHPPRIIMETDAKEMVKLYKKDPSIKTSTLAERYGCSIQTIRNTLRRAGVYQARPTLQNVAKRKGLPAPESTDSSDDSESLSDTEYQPKRQRQNVQDYKVEQANSIPKSNLQSSEKTIKFHEHVQRACSPRGRYLPSLVSASPPRSPFPRHQLITRWKRAQNAGSLESQCCVHTVLTCRNQGSEAPTRTLINLFLYLMDWTNDMVLEFLQVIATEPIIWNPKHPDHKKKHLLANAWQRINTTLNWQCDVLDLKRKRDSLMAYYRIHLNKIRRLKSLGKSTEDDYKTNWFAFDTMNSFLGSIYDCAVSSNVEVTEDIGSEKIRPVPESTDSANFSAYLSDTECQPKRKRVQKFIIEQGGSRPEKNTNECEMYVQLLEYKLNNLEEEERLILMNKIDNLVFQTTMESKAKKKRALAAFHVSSANQVSNTNTETIRSRSSYNDYDNEIPSPSYQSEESPREPRTDKRLIANRSHEPSPNNMTNSQSSNSYQNVDIKEEI